MPKLKLGYVSQRVLACLEQNPQGIDIHRLVAAVYHGSIDGGPLHARQSLHVIIHRLKRKLPDVGCTIRANGLGAGTLYSLVRE